MKRRVRKETHINGTHIPQQERETTVHCSGGREGGTPAHYHCPYLREEREREERERECELPPLTQISRDGGEARNSASRLKGNGELVARNFSRSVL